MNKLIVVGLFLLCLTGCKESQKVDPAEVCDNVEKVCHMADELCALDEKVAATDVCKKRGEVCEPAKNLCAMVHPPTE